MYSPLSAASIATAAAFSAPRAFSPAAMLVAFSDSLCVTLYSAAHAVIVTSHVSINAMTVARAVSCHGAPPPPVAQPEISSAIKTQFTIPFLIRYFSPRNAEFASAFL